MSKIDVRLYTCFTPALHLLYTCFTMSKIDVRLGRGEGGGQSGDWEQV
jgi:hypothetical protein